jgi:hypothetical protein
MSFNVVQDYTDLITSEHQNQPDYVQTVALSLQPYVDGQNVLASLPGLFDVDAAVGQQLDFVGQWVGITRYIQEPLAVYFSWDVANLGWDAGVWDTTYEGSSVTVALDDFHYRILIKAKIVANQWDGTVSGAYNSWNTLFAPEGYQILIQCGESQVVPFFAWDEALQGWDQAPWFDNQMDLFSNGNMTITLCLLIPTGATLDPLTIALFTGGYLGLKGAGVFVEDYVVQSIPGGPLFAWDVGPESGPATFPPTTLAGWDIGNWGIATPGS